MCVVVRGFAGGGTVSPAVRAIFADPWPEDALASFMLCIARRLLSAPAAASYLLGCAAAVATVAPSRVCQEQVHTMWDVCLRCASVTLSSAHDSVIRFAGVSSFLPAARVHQQAQAAWGNALWLLLKEGFAARAGPTTLA